MTATFGTFIAICENAHNDIKDDNGVTSAQIGFGSRRCHLHQVTRLVAAISLLVLGQAGAGVISAISPSLTDVASAIASASDGDTVVIPSGTAIWTQSLTVTKGITIQGSTTTDTSSGAGTSTDLTIIRDDVPRVNGNANLITFSLTSRQAFRLTGITFRYGVTVTTEESSGNGLIVLLSSSHSNRVDHCHFDQLYGYHFTAAGDPWGVMDHCIFDVRPGQQEIISIRHGTWGNNADGYGDGSWADPPYFGTGKFWFIEDCIINNLMGTNTTNGMVDVLYGGRCVLRHNIHNSCSYGNHDTGPQNRVQAGRVLEVYNELFAFSSFLTGSANVTQFRCGTGLLYNNTYTGTIGNNQNNGIVVYRTSQPYQVWGGASGNNSWDFNDTTDYTGITTYGNGGGPNGLMASGTHTGANAATVLMDSTQNWTTNVLKPGGLTVLQIENLDKLVFGFPNCTTILSNTATTVSYVLSGTMLKFDTGDRYRIYKPLVAIHQAGRGRGDLITGTTPVNSTTGTQIWPHDALEPIYAWNNIKTGFGYLPLHSGLPTVLPNRDYYDQAAAVGGAQTVGVGVGTHAQRPANCTTGTDVAGGSAHPGVGYWETDTSTFFVCSATNTWTQYYQPYIYPHPLVSGVPRPPANLRVTSGP